MGGVCLGTRPDLGFLAEILSSKAEGDRTRLALRPLHLSGLHPYLRSLLLFLRQTRTLQPKGDTVTLPYTLLYQHTVVRLRLVVQQQQPFPPPTRSPSLPTPFHPTMMVQSSILSLLALSALSVTPAAAAGHHNGHSSSAHHQRRFGLAGRKGHAAANAHLDARDIHGRQLPGTMAMRKRSDGSTCKVRPVVSSSVASSSVAASSAAPSSSAVVSSTAPVSSAAAPSSSSTEDEWTQTSSTAAAATSSAWVAPTTTSVRLSFCL